jgi:hypothetical protein
VRSARLFACALLLAGGCLVPAYEATEMDSSGNGAGTAGAGGAAGNVATGGVGAAGTNTGTECGTNQKWCAEMCVAIDDVTYGCTPTSCNQSACPAGGDTFVCADGACVIAGCGTGSKLCDGKCVAVNDPSYGCGESGCDASSCPDPGDGTLICNGHTCEVGVCTADTKQCGVNCVPPDANHGCADPMDCEPCSADEVCRGLPNKCNCATSDYEACMGIACGEVEACGVMVKCEGVCDSTRPLCVDNRCIQCRDVNDCETGGNPCVVADCVANLCVYSPTGSSTSCNRGTCSNTFPGVCVRAPVDADGVSIDATEVTRGAYSEFVADKGGDTSGQPSTCSWNTDYDPSTMLSGIQPWPAAFEHYELPISAVDWCDAYAYCSWAGRKLCGSIGSAPAEFDDYLDATKSQWFHACVGASDRQYPYGNTFDQDKCNGAPDGIEAAPVATFDQCVGAYAGIYDLSGNLSEWEDSCVPSDDRVLCHLRGGSYYPFTEPAPSVLLACNAFEQWNTQAQYAHIGFRCCGK